MYCTKCAKELGDDVKFCDSCGQPTSNTQTESTYTPPKVSVGQENKVIFILAYLGFLFFLPLVSCPGSQEGKFHANQGLLLLIASIAGQIVLQILFSISWRLWGIISLISTAWWIALLVLMIIGMVNANKGLQKPLPIIGEITLIK